jgi:hypothetical protein
MSRVRRRIHSKHLVTEEGRQAIEVRITTVEPARGKDSDTTMIAASATSWSRIRSGGFVASSFSRAVMGTPPQRKGVFADASTPGLRSRFQRAD